MSAGKCRACDGPLSGPRPVNASGHACTVKMAAISPDGRRAGVFRICPRCVSKATSGHHDLGVAGALVAELRALLK